MPSDPTRKQPASGRASALDMIDSLIGTPEKPAKKTKGRSVLLAHAMAQRENRMRAEKRAAASRMSEPSKPAAEASRTANATGARPLPAARPDAPQRRAAAPDRAPAERTGLDAMIVKALGPSARGYVRGGALDRESALTDLIARTQDRLNNGTGTEAPARQPAPVATQQPAAGGDREAIIAAAMRTHRDRQAVFDELSLRQRATLRATAEAMVAKGGQGK